MAERAARRAPWQSWLANVSTYAFFPLVGAVAFEALGGPATARDRPGGVRPAGLRAVHGTNVLNFLLIAVDIAVVDGWSIRASVRDDLRAGPARRVRDGPADRRRRVRVPGTPRRDRPARCHRPRVPVPPPHGAELDERKEQLEGRTHELAALQVGLLGTVLQTLSLRDKMTARHSAAVARYSREIAPRAGAVASGSRTSCTPPALLHDIGKFIFPDSILFADTKLTARTSRSSGGTRAGGAARRAHRRLRAGRRDHPRATTSASTATAIRAVSSASRSRSRRGSSPSPTRTT